VLVVLETLRAQIASADAELKALASEDARMRRLMTVPGVAPVTSARFDFPSKFNCLNDLMDGATWLLFALKPRFRTPQGQS
jgi:transposase